MSIAWPIRNRNLSARRWPCARLAAEPAGRHVGGPAENPDGRPVESLRHRREGPRSHPFSGARGRWSLFLNGRCQWLTSNFYRDELPAYLRSWNNSDALDRYSGKTWDLLYERSRYRHPAKEDSFGEHPSKSTVDFPHKIHAIGSRDYYHDLLESPFGSEITLEAARMIIADEQLGMDEYPDILGINLTPNDYVGHAYGPESLEVEDITYRTDRMLGEFIDFINERLEGRPWIFVLTADHGVTPIPERAARYKLDAKRNPLVIDRDHRPGPANQMLEAHLRRVLGVTQTEPTFVQEFTDIQVYLRTNHPALRGSKFVEAERATRDWLLSQDCVAAAVTREQCLSGGATGRTEAMLRRSFHPRRRATCSMRWNRTTSKAEARPRTGNRGNATRTFLC